MKIELSQREVEIITEALEMLRDKKQIVGNATQEEFIKVRELYNEFRDFKNPVLIHKHKPYNG